MGRSREACAHPYEMEGVTREIAEAAFRLAAHKLPIKTRFVTREEMEIGA